MGRFPRHMQAPTIPPWRLVSLEAVGPAHRWLSVKRNTPSTWAPENQLYTLPETDELHLKMDGFLLGWLIFRSYVGFIGLLHL